MIGEDISALANSAVLADHSHAYMIWGVDDDTHDIVGTMVRLKSEKKATKNWKIGCDTCFQRMPTLSFMMWTLTANMWN